MPWELGLDWQFRRSRHELKGPSMAPETSRLPVKGIRPPGNAPPAASSVDGLADRLRGFGPIGVFAIFVIAAGTLATPLLGAVLVLGWARRSHTPWHEIGYVRPRSWIGSLAIGIAFGCALKLLLKSVAMPLLGADPSNPTYHYLIGNTAALPAILFAVIVGAGFGEETVYRGYLFERLGKLLGTGVAAKILTVILAAGLFALVHYPEQGLAGVQQAVITGLTFGSIFATVGRLWMLMVAHATYDLTSVAIIYFNLENDAAHLVFK
jgi:membrane protease YdiL (CAAX protease family)